MKCSIKLMLCLALLLFTTGMVNATNETTIKKRLTITKGQVFSIVAPDVKEEGKAAINEYYQRAFPLAENFGLKRHFGLSTGAPLVGNYAPDGFIFFSWPDQASEKQLTDHPEWPEIKALRPAGWDELKIYSSLAEQDIDITFDSRKFYTLAVAWFNPEKPDDYNAYLKGIEETVGEIGGRFILKVHHPKFEAHASELGSPGQITLVEWDSPEGLPALQQSDAFKTYSPLLSSGVIAFELHNIVPKA